MNNTQIDETDTYKSIIKMLERRIRAQQPDIDALSLNPDNNAFVNIITVAKARREEAEAILTDCIALGYNDDGCTVTDNLIANAKEFLDGYHIDMTKYTGAVFYHDNEVTASIRFTSIDTKQGIQVDCYYDGDEILQAEMYFI